MLYCKWTKPSTMDFVCTFLFKSDRCTMARKCVARSARMRLGEAEFDDGRVSRVVWVARFTNSKDVAVCSSAFTLRHLLN